VKSFFNQKIEVKIMAAAKSNISISIEFKNLIENADKSNCSIAKYCENEGITQIDFVPAENVGELENSGFFVFSDWIDFFNDDIANTPVIFEDYNAIQFLQSGEQIYIKEMTTMCADLSRGFSSETEEWFIDWQKDNGIIVIKDGTVLVGYCCVAIYDNGNIAWIRRIAVKPEYQGKGYGKALMEQAIVYGIAKGAKRGFLASDVLNANAIALYKKYGFVPQSETGEITMKKSTHI
jgi:ribosomal protein S18 acetylase RimI-like enzyme